MLVFPTTADGEGKTNNDSYEELQVRSSSTVSILHVTVILARPLAPSQLFAPMSVPFPWILAMLGALPLRAPRSVGGLGGSLPLTWKLDIECWILEIGRAVPGSMLPRRPAPAGVRDYDVRTSRRPHNRSMGSKCLRLWVKSGREWRRAVAATQPSEVLMGFPASSQEALTRAHAQASSLSYGTIT